MQKSRRTRDGATRAGASSSVTKDGASPDPAFAGAAENALEVAIGHQVRVFRGQLGMTVADLAAQAGLSKGMLSKIENGLTSPSLGTLKALSLALNVPVTSFFRKYEEARDVSFVRSGEGVSIERRGTRAGHQYRLLGHTVSRQPSLEPYLISLTESSDVFPLFQHTGVEFIHMLEGEVVYHHAGRRFHLKPGDSLTFDADAPHGPEELVTLPIRFLSIICEAGSGG